MWDEVPALRGRRSRTYRDAVDPLKHRCASTLARLHYESAIDSMSSAIDQGSSGLDRPSRAVANQLRTVARHRITKRLGRLQPGELEALDRAIMIHLGLRREP